MSITLAPEQLAWIEARVASGAYPDVDEAVRSLLADAIEDHEAWKDDDMAWAKPLVDEALAEVERGGVRRRSPSVESLDPHRDLPS